MAQYMMGIDESGTGAWASCFCIGLVVLSRDIKLPGVKDSKKLSDRKRRDLVGLIQEASIWTDVGYVYPADIRAKGQALAWQDAIVLAVKFAVEELHAKEIPLSMVDVMIDGAMNRRLWARVSKIHPKLRKRVYMEPKADEAHLAVSAASILAKTARNDALLELHEQYPEYGFNKHYGYGTEDHAMALSVFGRTKHHRPLTDD